MKEAQVSEHFQLSLSPAAGSSKQQTAFTRQCRGDSTDRHRDGVYRGWGYSRREEQRPRHRDCGKFVGNRRDRDGRRAWIVRHGNRAGFGDIR